MPTVFKIVAVLGGLLNGAVYRVSVILQPPPGAGAYYPPQQPSGSSWSDAISVLVALATALGLGGVLKVWFEKRQEKLERIETDQTNELKTLRRDRENLRVWAARAEAVAEAKGVGLPPIPLSVPPPPDPPTQ